LQRFGYDLRLVNEATQVSNPFLPGRPDPYHDLREAIRLRTWTDSADESRSPLPDEFALVETTKSTRGGQRNPRQTSTSSSNSLISSQTTVTRRQRDREPDIRDIIRAEIASHTAASDIERRQYDSRIDSLTLRLNDLAANQLAQSDLLTSMQRDFSAVTKELQKAQSDNAQLMASLFQNAALVSTQLAQQTAATERLLAHISRLEARVPHPSPHPASQPTSDTPTVLLSSPDNDYDIGPISSFHDSGSDSSIGSVTSTRSDHAPLPKQRRSNPSDDQYSNSI
jgi:hypothetical protein